MTGYVPENKTDKSTEVEKVDNGKSPMKREGLFAYFHSSWLEFKKVVWPDRNDAVKMTVFVVVFAAVLSVFIYGVDSVISWLFFDFLLKRG